MENKNLYREEHPVKFNEIDASGLMNVRSLFNCLQEAAYNSSRVLGTSIDAMQVERVTWVYTRLLVEVSRYPSFMENLRLSTWRSHCDGNTAFREFLMEDPAGAVIARATAQLVLLSIDTRRPAEIPEFMKSQFAPELGSAASVSVEKLAEPGAPENEIEFRVRSSDIDINGHVNNAAYAEFITECVPREVVMSLRPSRVVINFLAEVFYGQRIISRSACTETGSPAAAQVFSHSLVRSDDARTVARSRTEWGISISS